MTPSPLRETVERLAADAQPPPAEAREAVAGLLEALEAGRVRAAEPDGDGWCVHRWVKEGILLGFRIGANEPSDVGAVFHFNDRDTFPTLDPRRYDGRVRIVPGGTTVRRGSYLAEGVVIMPPAYVNVGAHVGPGSMIDSHVLVGTCAQVGAKVHLSAGVQIGGVLEPAGAMPVVIEDGAFIGGGCGVYEGTRVGARAVLAPGVMLTRSVRVYDLVREQVYRAQADGAPLCIPDGAVVVPGSRPARGDYAAREGLHLQAPVIVKYRDAGTEVAVALEQALR